MGNISKSWVADQPINHWLQNDPTSVPAMIRGRGDGREKLWERFRSHHLAMTPAVTEEELLNGYAEYTLGMYAKWYANECARWKRRQKIKSFMAAAKTMSLDAIDRYLLPVTIIMILAKLLVA